MRRHFSDNLPLAQEAHYHAHPAGQVCTMGRNFSLHKKKEGSRPETFFFLFTKNNTN